MNERLGIFGLHGLGDGADVVDRARFVVDVHDRDDRRVAAHGFGDRGGIDDALFRHGKRRQPPAVFLQKFAASGDGGMLDGVGDEVMHCAGAGVTSPHDRKVVALGAAAGENDGSDRRAADGAQNAPSRMVERFFRIERLRVGRGRVDPKFMRGADVFVRDALPRLRRCAVVEIDHDFHLYLNIVGNAKCEIASSLFVQGLRKQNRYLL